MASAHSTAKIPSEKMKFFAVLLCIAIGSVFGELERRQIAKEKLEITEDENKTSSLASIDDDRKIADSSDESLEAFLDKMAAGTKETDSVEQITSRKSSPVVDTSNVKPSYSKAIKVNLKKFRLGKTAKPFKELREITRPNNTESKTSKESSVNFLSRLLMSTDAFGRKERNLASNSRKILRLRRAAEVEDPTILVESFTTYKNLRGKLPTELRKKIRKTDTAEEKLLQGYAESKGDTSNLVADYKAAKLAEREQLKVDAGGPGATEVIGNYKALRKGKPWNYVKLRGKFKGIFGKTSSSLTDYENLKQDEAASIDSFLGGSSNPESEKQATNAPSQENEKPAASSYPLGIPWNSKKVNWLGEYLDRQLAKPDPWSGQGSLDLYGFILECFRLPDGTNPMADAMGRTDAAENKLLEKFEAASKVNGVVKKEEFGDYYAARKQEIEALKECFKAHPAELKPRILLAYKACRKGVSWIWLKNDFFDYLEKQSPTLPSRVEFDALKKEEKYTDEYLDGSLKIGEVPENYGNSKPESSERQSSQTKTEKNYRKILKAEVAELSRAEEDEKVEELKRGVRVKEEETIEVEYDAHRENCQSVIATPDADAKGDVEEGLRGRLDNVTETARETKAKDDSSHLLRFLILFAMVVQVIVVILILGPQRDKLAVWCWRKQKGENVRGPAETDPLQAGKKVFVTGSDCKISISSQRRSDEADENE